MATPSKIEYEGYTIGEQKTTVKGKVYTRHAVDFGRDSNGKRVRRSFATPAKAKQAIREHLARQKADSEAQAILQRRIGEKADKLGTDDLLDAAAAKDVLSGAVTLTDAARFWIEHNRPDGPRKTIAQLVEDYVASRRKANRRPETIRDIRVRLGAGVSYMNGVGERDPHGFAKDFAATDCRHVTTTDLERWLENAPSDSERRKARTHLVGLFNFAKKRKYVRDNPAEPIDIPTVDTDTTPYVLPVADAQKLMAVAELDAPEMVPYFALCLFAGIRPIEARRLDWKDIHLRKRSIFIRKDVSKTRDERYVDIADNLLAFLVEHKSTGQVFFSRKPFDRVRRKAGIRWEHDCLRHSFGSYHLAEHGNAGETALQMGHRQLGMLFKHYRQAVEKPEATRFWKIKPTKESNVIQMRKAG